MDDLKVFAAKLRGYRIYNLMTLREMSVLTGVSIGTLNKIERRKLKRISALTKAKIIRRLGDGFAASLEVESGAP
jgi:transcriptional regulator with XRE-family HTH domain